MLSGSMPDHADLWTEELQLSGQKFRHLHGLLNHAQFKPLFGYNLSGNSEWNVKYYLNTNATIVESFHVILFVFFGFQKSHVHTVQKMTCDFPAPQYQQTRPLFWGCHPVCGIRGEPSSNSCICPHPAFCACVYAMCQAPRCTCLSLGPRQETMHCMSNSSIAVRGVAFLCVHAICQGPRCTLSLSRTPAGDHALHVSNSSIAVRGNLSCNRGELPEAAS